MTCGGNGRGEVTGAVQCPRAARCDGMGRRRKGGEKLKATSAGVRTFASPIDWRFGGMAPSFNPPATHWKKKWLQNILDSTSSGPPNGRVYRGGDKARAVRFSGLARRSATHGLGASRFHDVMEMQNVFIGWNATIGAQDGAIRSQEMTFPRCPHSVSTFPFFVSTCSPHSVNCRNVEEVPNCISLMSLVDIKQRCGPY